MNWKAGIRYLSATCFALACIGRLAAQIPSAGPAPFSREVPSGAAGCSIAKSCAEVAPDIIRTALGPSPLDEDLRKLSESRNEQLAGSHPISEGVDWSVKALRASGVASVHVEKFSIPGSAANPIKPGNVVAEIRGRELPEEFVILSGYLPDDVADDPVLRAREGPGAIVGNGAIVIEAARAIMASGSVPRRSIRFILFSRANGSSGGARAYAEAHRQELDRMIAAISAGATNRPVMPITGYSVEGREDVLPGVRKALEPIRALGASQFTVAARVSPDIFDFLLEGVPTLIPKEGQENVAARHPAAGTESNDAEPIDTIKQRVAIAAVTAYALADSDARIGSRLSRDQVEELLKNTGLGDQMRTAGIWNEWADGERGRR